MTSQKSTYAAFNLFSAVATLIFFSFTTLAQPASSAPVVPSANQAGVPDIEFYIADIQRLLDGHRIVFVAPTTAVSPFSNKNLTELNLDAPNLHQLFRIESVDSFPNLPIGANNVPVDALILTPDSLVNMDETALSWLKNEYWNGMIVGFFNVPLQTQWNLLGITCIEAGYFEDYAEDGYFTYSFATVAETPLDNARIIAAKQACIEDLDTLELQGGFRITQGMATDSLHEPFGIYQLFLVIGVQLENQEAISVLE